MSHSRMCAVAAFIAFLIGLIVVLVVRPVEVKNVAIWEFLGLALLSAAFWVP